jgi:hypothetical protein
MARVNRREVLSEGEVQVVHCINRCVRSGFLCGTDPFTGKCYEHRREWIRNRLEFLAAVFAVDVLGFSVMNNHMHVILRSRPDVVSDWSDEEIVRRWWNLFPKRRRKDGAPAELSDTEVTAMTGDTTRVQELRARLSSISWFMRCASEVIARLANGEDECSGRFWEGRFKAEILPDEAAIAACMVYVDLNPIRAGLAETPEKSDFTSGQDRISDLKSAEDVSTAGAKDQRIEHGAKAGWMAPIALEPRRKAVRGKVTHRRASNKGCVFMALPGYLQLLDWTGRQIRPDKRGAIPESVPGILDRLDLSEETWLNTVAHFGKRRKPVSVTPAAKFETSNAVMKRLVSINASL